MMAVTHIITAHTIATALGADPIGIVIADVCSILPDIDTPYSIAGRKTPLLPFIIRHRSITHSIFMLALVYILSHHIIGNYTGYAVLGWISHVLLDMLNPNGVELFWPHPAKINIANIRVRSIYEYIIILFIIIKSL